MLQQTENTVSRINKVQHSAGTNNSQQTKAAEGSSDESFNDLLAALVSQGSQSVAGSPSAVDLAQKAAPIVKNQNQEEPAKSQQASSRSEEQQDSKASSENHDDQKSTNDQADAVAGSAQAQNAQQAPAKDVEKTDEGSAARSELKQDTKPQSEQATAQSDAAQANAAQSQTSGKSAQSTAPAAPQAAEKPLAPEAAAQAPAAAPEKNATSTDAAAKDAQAKAKAPAAVEPAVTQEAAEAAQPAQAAPEEVSLVKQIEVTNTGKEGAAVNTTAAVQAAAQAAKNGGQSAGQSGQDAAAQRQLSSATVDKMVKDVTTAAGALQTDKKASTSAKDTSSAQKTAAPRQAMIIDQIQKMLETASSQKKSGDTLVMRLDPPELGNMTVKMTVRGDTLHARIIPESSEVETVLRSKVNEVVQALSGSGMKAENIQVSIGREASETPMFNLQSGFQQSSKQGDQSQSAPRGFAGTTGGVAAISRESGSTVQSDTGWVA